MLDIALQTPSCDIANAMPTKPIGTVLKESREAAKLSQRVLAKRTGISQPMISQIENGERNPTVDIVTRMEIGLGVIPGSIRERSEDVSLERFLRSDLAAELRVTEEEARQLRSTGWKNSNQPAPLAAWESILRALRYLEGPSG